MMEFVVKKDKDQTKQAQLFLAFIKTDKSLEGCFAFIVIGYKRMEGRSKYLPYRPHFQRWRMELSFPAENVTTCAAGMFS